MLKSIKNFFNKFGAAELALLLLNAVSFVFIVVYSFVRTGDTASTVFSALMVATFALNMLYFAFAKQRFAYLAIALTFLLYVVNVAGGELVGLSYFHNSVSIAGIVALALIPPVAIADILLKGFGKLQPKEQKALPVLRWIAGGIAIAGLLILVVLGIVTFCGVSAINSNIVNLTTLFLLLTVALFSVFVATVVKSHLKITPKTLTAVVAALLALTSLTEFSVIEGVAYGDAERARISYCSAFGSPVLLSSQVGEADPVHYLYRPRSSPYSYADEFFGVETLEYGLTRNILYYQGTEGVEKGATYRYDVYYPTFRGAQKAVLVNLHGSGGDKDTGNYAHRNKYFASRGYVVYDLQFGDYNEKDINVDWSTRERNVREMLDNVERFFQYAIANNDVGADFNNVFMTGVSMGGGLVSKYAYSYGNRLAEYGGTLRGILPVYPGYSVKDEGINNYLSYVTADSAPCLLFMSLSDVVVYRDVVEHTAAAYKTAGNPNYAFVGITYAGHGSDGSLSGRFNQAYLYYAERFLAYLTVR